MSAQLRLWADPASGQSQRVVSVRELPPSERPVYRLEQLGPEALSRIELLGILIGSPLQLNHASELLAAYGDLTSIARAPLAELERHDGIGPAVAARVKAALALASRLGTDAQDRAQIRSPADAANLLLPDMSLLEQEQMRTILLDTKNRVLHIQTVYIGSLNTTMVRIGELFREAVRRQCAAIVLAHNHPSGDPTPSPEDVIVTKQAVEAGKLLDIDVLDHIIIGHHQFVSLKERGLGW